MSIALLHKIRRTLILINIKKNSFYFLLKLKRHYLLTDLSNFSITLCKKNSHKKWSFIPDTIYRVNFERPTNGKQKTGRPTSRTSVREIQPKRLGNKVDQRFLGRTFDVDQGTVGRQISKADISVIKYCMNKINTFKTA